jgi:hypothetical protein
VTASHDTREAAPAQPVADLLADVARLAAARDPAAQDRLAPAIVRGSAPREVVQRFALEHCALVRWIVPEVALLVANAPDAYDFTMAHSVHYRRWADDFAGAAGYLGGVDGVARAIELCRRLGLAAADVRAHEPLPETIATAFTALYHVRRSYEEGLAVLAHADRFVAGGADPAALVDGLARHYGAPVDALEPWSGARAAAALLRGVAVTPATQARCRDAVRNCLLVAETRIRAMNRWLP